VNASDERTRFPVDARIAVLSDAASLRGSLKTDTLIVGSRIAGLSAAYELSQAGQKVIVVDLGAVAGGMTSRTTAHLAPICDNGLSTLVSLRGLETAKLFQQSQAAAVDRIKAIVDRHGIHCDFRRLDGYPFPRWRWTVTRPGSSKPRNSTPPTGSARPSSTPTACR
jgi:choline dehydrogenase-like flavoprotein